MNALGNIWVIGIYQHTNVTRKKSDVTKSFVNLFDLACENIYTQPY